MSKKFIKTKRIVTLGLTALMLMGSSSSFWDLPESELNEIALNPLSITVYAADLTNQFKDEIPQWASSDISYLVDKGIMKGYEDNTFRANGTMTRLEFLKATVCSLKTEAEIDSLFEQAKKKFTFDEYDKVSDYQIYKNEVEYTLKQGKKNTKADDFWGTRYLIASRLLNIRDENGGYAGESMYGDTIAWTLPVTRQEAATLMYNALTKVKGENLPFSVGVDNIISDYNKIESQRVGAVANLVSNGLIAGIDSNYTFAPKKTLTRAEACCIIARITDTNRRLAKPVVPKELQYYHDNDLRDDVTYKNPVTGKTETHSPDEWNRVLEAGYPNYDGKTNGELSPSGYYEWNAVLGMWNCLVAM